MDYLIWGGVTLVVGAPIGAAMAKGSSLYLTKKDKIKIVRVIEGEIPNTLKLDGELINVDKFKYKKSDGEIVKVNLKDIAKNASQKAPIQEKQSFLNILKNKFRKKK